MKGGMLTQALRIVWEASPRGAVACAVCVAARSVLPLVLLWAMGRMVDATLASFETLRGNPWDGLRAIAAPVAAFGAAMLATHAAQIVADLKTEELGERLRAHVASLTQRQMARVDYQTLQSPQFQTEAFRAISGSTERPVRIFSTAMGLTQSFITFCVLSCWMFAIGWWLPLLTMAAGAPIVLARVAASRKSFELYKRQAVDERKMAYYNSVLTQPQYAPEVRTFGLWDHFHFLFDAVRQGVAASRLGLARQSAVRQGLAALASTLIVVGVFVCVIAQCSAGGYSVGALAMFLMTIRRAESAVADAAHRGVSLHSQGLYVSSLLDFLRQGSGSARTARFPTPFGRLEVHDVSFRYPGSRRKALSGVSFSIRRGEVVGIAGRNGCGKSTLVKLMCGLLRPDAGSVMIDGIPVADIAPTEISAHMTAVFQDFRLYCATAQDNIRFGNMAAHIDESRMRSAATQAGIDHLMESLPQGYATEIGNQFPGSEMFSRGEWQRLALARALYSQADIIILDEAASALDKEARQGLRATIDDLRQAGKTVILVTHSAETLSLADRVHEM